MPKKSKGSKSKRMTLSKKYKIKKKVKEHHKKQAKEAKKAAKRPGAKHRVAEKDPGIPSQWPYKEELLKELAFEKQLILAQEKERKEARRAAQVQAAAGTAAPADQAMDSDGEPMEPAEQPASLGAVQHSAQARQEAFAAGRGLKRKAEEAGVALQDGSRKAFYREFLKVVEAADVVVQVLDARDPLACRCTDVERAVRRAGADKRVVLLLNKIDLVPREAAEAWLKYLREELPTVAFKSSTQKQAANLARRSIKGKTASSAAEGPAAGSECLGADTLLQLLKNYSRSGDSKTAITVGIVGLPNVGKSSVINSLKRARVAQVGNTPGVTRAVQEVVLDRKVRLLDSPGIVFSDAAAAEGAAAHALRNCVKVEQLQDPGLPVKEILRRCPQQQLMAIYKVPAFDGTDQFLQHVAAARGKLRKGGTADVDSAARLVLHDWNDGRIPFFTLPPQREDSAAAAQADVVGSWGKDFDADEAYQQGTSAVVAGLPSLTDAGSAHFQTQAEPPMPFEQQGPEAQAMDVESQGDAEDGPDSRTADEPSTAAPAAAPGKGSQMQELYSEPGQFNPHTARAARKRAKKQAAAQAATDDYNFAEAFGQQS